MLTDGRDEHVKYQIRLLLPLVTVLWPPMAADSVYPDRAHARGNMSLLGYLSHVKVKST